MSFVSLLATISGHEKELRGIFGVNCVYDGPEIFDHPLYCIGFFNRSGSNLLADYLRATPYFTGFLEYLNFKFVKHASSEWGVHSFPDFIREANAILGKPQFVHGFKASATQLMMLQRFGIPRMYKGGMRIIHITRNDLIGQAISYQIASQTQKWDSNQASPNADLQVNFDAEQITNIIQIAQQSNTGITMFAEIFGCPRLHVTYEELVKAPDQILSRIAEFADQGEVNWPVVKSRFERQASEINDRFREMYHESVRESLL